MKLKKTLFVSAQESYERITEFSAIASSKHFSLVVRMKLLILPRNHDGKHLELSFKTLGLQ